VPGDDPCHDLTQTPTRLQRERLPELRQQRLLRVLGLGDAEGYRRGGLLSGLYIRYLLNDRRADIDTTVRALTKPIHSWLPQAATRYKLFLES
jgi:hypothetical protein